MYELSTREGSYMSIGAHGALGRVPFGGARSFPPELVEV